jgi:hypothetical protein
MILWVFNYIELISELIVMKELYKYIDRFIDDIKREVKS